MNNPNQKEAPKFRDAAGNEWTLTLNIGLSRRIKAELRVDVGQHRDGRVFVDVNEDDEKLAGVLWLIVEKQAEAAKVTPEQFAEALDGDAIDGAMEALREAIVLFTRSHQRPAMKAILAKTRVAEEKTATAAQKWIEAHADKMIETEIAKAMGSLPTSGGPSPT